MILFCTSKIILVVVTLSTQDSPSSGLITVSVMQLAVDAGVLFALGDLMVFHIYLACKGISTYQYIQNQRSQEAAGRLVTTNNYADTVEGERSSAYRPNELNSITKSQNRHLTSTIEQRSTEMKGLMSTTRGAGHLAESQRKSGEPLRKDEMGSGILKRPTQQPVPFGPKSGVTGSEDSMVPHHQRAVALMPSSLNHPIRLMVGKLPDDDDLDPEEELSERDPHQTDQGSQDEPKDLSSRQNAEESVGDMSHDYEHNIMTALGAMGLNQILGEPRNRPILKSAIDQALLSKLGENGPREGKPATKNTPKEQLSELEEKGPEQLASGEEEGDLLNKGSHISGHEKVDQESKLSRLASEEPEDSFSREPGSPPKSNNQLKDKLFKMETNPLWTGEKKNKPQRVSDSREGVEANSGVLPGARSLEGPSNSTGGGSET